MKQLVYSVLLLAALLAGCASKPSQEAAIEDRGIRATEAVPTEGVRIAEASSVQTKPATGMAAVSESASKVGDGVITSSATGQPITSRPTESVQTHGMAAPGSEVKSLTDGSTLAAGGIATVDGKNGVGAAASSVGGGVSAGQDGSLLPQPDAAPTWGDLRNPENALSKRRLLFDYDSAAIREEYRPVLEAHVQFMKTNKDAKAILQGHADERGSREYNLALGQRRAESVFNAMNLLGVPEAQMEAVSMGEEKPVVEGHDEVSWQQNRRTEILYQGE